MAINFLLSFVHFCEVDLTPHQQVVVDDESKVPSPSSESEIRYAKNHYDDIFIFVFQSPGISWISLSRAMLDVPVYAFICCPVHVFICCLSVETPHSALDC